MKQLKKFILWLIGLGLICIIGISNVFGATTKTIYSGVDSSGNLTGSNQYNYGYMTGGGTIGITSASVGNTIQGISYGFTFSLYENTLLSNTYTLKIYFKADDLKSNFSSNMVDIKTCTTTSCNSAVIVSVEKSNPTGYSTNITIKFNPVVIGSYIQVNLGGNNQAITGVSTFGISSVTIDSENQNEDIMNNANQNANNIIANQNSSASAIQDTINDNFNTISYCQNLFDGVYENGSIGTSNGVPTSTASVIRTKNFTTIEENTNYTMTLPNGATGVIFLFYNNGTYINSKQPTVSNGKTTVLSSSSANQVKWRFNTGFTNLSNQTMFEKGNVSSSYCAYGSSSSVNKLDEAETTRKGILGKLGELISNLFDTSGPDTDSISGVSGWLPAGPIDTILNLPITLYNGYSSALESTCSPLEIPIPFLTNNTLTLPCPRTILTKIRIITFWDTFGLFLAGVLLYNYLLSLYAWYDRTTSLKSTGPTGNKGFGGDA